MLEKTKAFCDSLLGRGLPGFDLAVYRDGKCILRHMNGYSDLENKIPVNGSERYNIYSCSKVITCTAALQLWEKGLFSLEDSLSLYMPEFAEMTVKTADGVKKAEKPILIRHLFEMTAGFSYAVHSPFLLQCREETEGKCPTREAMKYLAKEPLLFEPGDRWEYSLCHDVLAALVEVLSGESFEDYVRKNIFEVVGMTRSTFMLPEAELDTIAEQYRFEKGKAVNVGKEIIPYKIGTCYASGGAGGISTVDDYMKFLEALRTHKLLKPETLALMMTDRLSEAQSRTYWTKETHGYGLGVRCPKKGETEGEFGWGGAAGAFLSINMGKGLSMYFASHLLSSPVQGLRSMVYRFVHAELFDPSELDGIYESLKSLYNYHLTY
ncbi:MAG: beta-lactamase family protein [Clostridia bacterium]|nr:beta-lactamase family protein [Clostridia bacterium]MBO7169934.1 beta-lactamase family protein [Clostridia bacterium]